MKLEFENLRQNKRKKFKITLITIQEINCSMNLEDYNELKRKKFSDDEITDIILDDFMSSGLYKDIDLKIHKDFEII